MTKTRTYVTCFAAVLAMAAWAGASVPNLISYQGQLNDAGGAPVNGSVSFTFSIYDVPTGGTALWTENQTLVVSNGVFSVQLGAVQPVPSSLFTRDVLYLGVRAGADAEMTPRQQITSSAYAHKAELAVPIGTILPWAKSIPGVPAIWDGWVECNGQVLSDPDSPLNGQTIPDLNGTSGPGRFLRGSSTSGGTGGTEDHKHQWLSEGGGTRRIGVVSSGAWGALSWFANGSLNNIQTSGSLLVGEYYTSTLDSKPSYYEVVLIMRVK